MKYGIFDRQTGRQHKPRSRGITGYLYESVYAAESAIAAMPSNFRDRYETRSVKSKYGPLKG